MDDADDVVGEYDDDVALILADAVDVDGMFADDKDAVATFVEEFAIVAAFSDDTGFTVDDANVVLLDAEDDDGCVVFDKDTPRNSTLSVLDSSFGTNKEALFLSSFIFIFFGMCADFSLLMTWFLYL